MTALPLKPHDLAPDFSVIGVGGKPISLEDYRFRQELFLVALHGPSCPHCAQIAEELIAQRDDWESWGVTLLVLLSDPGPAFDAPLEQGRDPDGTVRLRYSSPPADAALAVLDRRGCFMDGWSLRHPEAVDWREISETARWAATQDHECPACEVLPGYDMKGSRECQMK